MSYLQKYVRQLRPRTENYIPPVDKIQSFLTEAAAQQGFVYEKNAAAALKKFGIVPPNFMPAGSGSSIPDLMIQKNGVKAGCELKISAASAGSLVLKNVDGTWGLGKTFTIIDGEEVGNEEKKFISDLADEYGAIANINKTWKDEAYKFATSPEIQEEMKSLSSHEKYQRDLTKFPDIKGEIPASKIEDYYNKKKTYYVNVGTHGFYLLGSTNPLKLKGIPRFGTAAKAKYRARVQYKSKNKKTGTVSYQFTFEMQFSISKANKSPFNIAPVTSKNNVKINMDKLKLDWFLK